MNITNQKRKTRIIKRLASDDLIISSGSMIKINPLLYFFVGDSMNKTISYIWLRYISSTNKLTEFIWYRMFNILVYMRGIYYEHK